MLTRLTHAAVAFAMTVAVYQAYVLFAVPFIEPTLAKQASELTNESGERQPPPVAPHKHRELFAAYFPAGHWTLAEPPKTFETGNAMIVLDDYQPRDDGQVRVTKCVMLFFPRTRERGEPPPRDAIVLEAPHGAVLQMDDAVQPGLSSMGRIQWARLVGDIVIRSDMREPGPEDDLLLTTRDLYMNEDLIRTDDKVEMQLGPHWGRGRVLEIRLMAVESGRVSTGGPQIGGIDSLEIVHDVRAQLTPGNAKLFGESAGQDSAQPTPPVKIASRGRFRFDFANNMASFLDQVQVIQEYENGQRDQLFCDELNLYFAGEEEAVDDATDRAAELTQVAVETNELAKLRPGSIEAKGGDRGPVVLEAPSRKADIRCDRMRVELDARRVTLDGSDEVVLKYDGSEIHAPMVRYQAPPEGSAQRIGNLLAAGNGWIRALTGDQGSQSFEVRWTDSMRLERVGGVPQLSLRGRPRLDMVGMGTLWANYLRVELRERKADGSEDELLPGDVVPQHIVASGLVGIESPELSGKVNELDVNIDYQPSEVHLGASDGRNSQSGKSILGKSRSTDSRAYHVVGNQLGVQLTVRQRRPEVSHIGVEGDVVFRESSTGNGESQPLVVRAQRLSVKDADTPNAEIDLRGQPATVTAAGMTIHAATLRLNRGTSRAWIDSPGQMQLPLDRGLDGQPLNSTQPLEIQWQNGMELDQNRITFRGRVKAQTIDGVLNTEQLVAVLSAPVRFDGAAPQRRSEIEQIECSEGVYAEFKQRDATGLTSIQVMQLESIKVNQRTGDIDGDGPGELESVHLTKGGNSLGSLSPAAARTGQKLGYLHVDFRRGVKGNMSAHRREIEVFGDTRAVYGPVDSWQQKLEISLRGTPGPGTIWITSDRLGVAESPLARPSRDGGIGPVELFASGNVTIEGPAGQRGTFTARAQRATYDQSKTMIILEGDAKRPAELYHQQYVGAPMVTNSARKVIYNQSTGEVKLEGIIKGEWNQIDLGQQPQAAPR